MKSEIRKDTPVDKMICNLDYFLKSTHSNFFNNKIDNNKDNLKSKNYPANNIKNMQDLTSQEKKSVIKMLKVNHCGEVCAQSLYNSQAAFAKDQKLKVHFEKSALEEKDHLNWCEIRLNELSAKPSILNPVFSAGSYLIGSSFAIAGDKWSLGFLAETEYQVTSHLEKHLKKIPSKDQRTIAILKQMKLDELEHATNAINKGANELPDLIKTIMKFTAKIMTYSVANI